MLLRKLSFRPTVDELKEKKVKLYYSEEEARAWVSRTPPIPLQLLNDHAIAGGRRYFSSTKKFT